MCCIKKNINGAISQLIPSGQGAHERCNLVMAVWLVGWSTALRRSQTSGSSRRFDSSSCFLRTEWNSCFTLHESLRPSENRVTILFQGWSHSWRLQYVCLRILCSCRWNLEIKITQNIKVEEEVIVTDHRCFQRHIPRQSELRSGRVVLFYLDRLREIVMIWRSCDGAARSV